MIADLTTQQRREEHVYHGLDPRLLVPGARLRVEILHFDEETAGQISYLKFLSFRWAPASASRPPSSGR